jgi:hypothetical protein
MTEARPAWPTAAGARRAIDLKLVVAVLIGLVSITGAVVAWQSALAGEKATDKDRQAVAETVAVSQSEANDEVIVQDARSRFADHAAALITATALDDEAERATTAGDGERARVAAEEAAEQRVTARRVLEGGTAPVLLADYVSTDEDTGRPALDESGLRDDLRQIAQAQAQVDPTQTVREANRLRADSERLDRWLIALVSAIVLLTLAQVSRAAALRFGLAGLGAAVWIASSVLIVSGN